MPSLVHLVRPTKAHSLGIPWAISIVCLLEPTTLDFSRQQYGSRHTTWSSTRLVYIVSAHSRHHENYYLLPQVTNQTGDFLASFLETVAIALGQFSDISRSVPAFRRQVQDGLDDGLNFDLTILVKASFINTGSPILSGGCLSTWGFFLVVALKST